MTASLAQVIRCDTPGCDATIIGRIRETVLEQRIRAARDHAWTLRGDEDYCEVHG